MLDTFTGNASLAYTADRSVTTAFIERYLDGKPFTTDTAMVLDYILLNHTQNGNKANDPTIIFSLSEYMEARGLKDRKNARKSLIDNVDLLARTSLSFTGKADKKESFKAKNQGRMNLIDSYFIANGVITVKLAPTFNSFVTAPQTAYPMPYLKALLKVNTHKHPYTYQIGRWLQYNLRVNYPNERRTDYINMRTLLKACTGLPTKEEVKKSRGSYAQKIIEPILRDIGVITEIEVEYLTPDKSRVVSADELISMSYDDFVNLVVHVTDWKDYPVEMLEQWHQNGLDHKHKPRRKRS